MRILGRVLSPALIGFMLFWASSGASGKCLDDAYSMNLPEAIDAAKLGNGEHVVASVPTAHGSLEARATVKDGKMTRGDMFLNGKPLKPILESKLPAHTRACIGKLRKGAADQRSSLMLIANLADQEAQGTCFFDKTNKLYWGVGRGCSSNLDTKYQVVEVYDEGGGPVYVTAIIQHGRICGYMVT